MDFDSRIIAYANDVKLINLPGQQLQNDVDKLSKWASENVMSYDNKCEKSACIHLGKRGSETQNWL